MREGQVRCGGQNNGWLGGRCTTLQSIHKGTGRPKNKFDDELREKEDAAEKEMDERLKASHGGTWSRNQDGDLSHQLAKAHAAARGEKAKRFERLQDIYIYIETINTSKKFTRPK